METANAAAVFSNFGLDAAAGDAAMAAGDSVGALVTAVQAAHGAAAPAPAPASGSSGGGSGEGGSSSSGSGESGSGS